jgi:hypothetical protein
MLVVHFERVASLDRDGCFPPEGESGDGAGLGEGRGWVVPALPIGADGAQQPSAAARLLASAVS